MGSHGILFWNGGVDLGEEHGILLMVLLKQKRYFLNRLVWCVGDHPGEAHPGSPWYSCKEGRR